MKWQEEFKKKFNPIYSGDMSGGYDAMPYLLEYIESLLEEQRKELEASIRKEVVEDILNIPKQNGRVHTLKSISTYEIEEYALSKGITTLN